MHVSKFQVYLILPSILFAGSLAGSEPGQLPPGPKEGPGTERPVSLEDLGWDSDREPRAAFEDEDREMACFWSDNLRLTLDLSSRVTLSTRRGKVGSEQVIGLDLHKVFSDASGDWGTLRLQPYLTRIDNLAPRAPFFEDDDDWELAFRFFDFNYTRVDRGRLNFRIGHFEIPYGLEHLIDTNGTVRQLIPGRNLGLKADWGVSANGVLPYFDYELALTRGTGNEFFHRRGPFTVAGRIGTPRDRNVILGMSVFHGRVWSPAAVGQWRSGLRPPSRVEADRGLTDTAGGRGRDDILRRTRFGIDVQWYLGTFGMLAEVSFGRDYNQDVFNGLAEINWSNADDTWFA
ncbi:MAG: hypothetical protein IH988_04770, partial [Planctomycetes bacterium]|nr:hypothetical protein [Planctomycetota bacterium]